MGLGLIPVYFRVIPTDSELYTLYTFVVYFLVRSPIRVKILSKGQNFKDSCRSWAKIWISDFSDLVHSGVLKLVIPLNEDTKVSDRRVSKVENDPFIHDNFFKSWVQMWNWSHHCSFLSWIILAFCFFGILPYFTESRLMPTSMHFLNLQNWHLFLFILKILHVPFFGHWRYASWLLIVLRKNPCKHH